MEENQQREFLKRMQEAVGRARRAGGVISREQLEKVFTGLELSQEQKKSVETYLQGEGIGVGKSLPVEEVITEQEHNYLKDYEEQIRAIERPDDGVLEATEISAMAGDRQAQQDLVLYMLSDVLDIARLYAGQGVMIEDLIGAGNEALVRAVELLAPLEGPEEVPGVIAKRVMDAMEDLIEENLDSAATGNEVAEKVNKVADAAKELSDALGRTVTAAELVNEGEVTLEEIRQAQQLSGQKIETLKD